MFVDENDKYAGMYRLVSFSIVLLFMLGTYFGMAKEAVLILLPVLIVINFVKMRTAHMADKLPRDLSFISLLRGDREAFAWGYVILILMAVFWVVFVVILGMKELL